MVEINDSTLSQMEDNVTNIFNGMQNGVFSVFDKNMPEHKQEDMIVDALLRLRDNAMNETFEDGMDTKFSIGLRTIIQNCGTPSIKALDKAMPLETTSATIMEELLRQIGNMDDPPTHKLRLALLERALESPDSRIRDAATIGMDAMGDPKAIPSIKKAIACEPDEWIRKNLKTILEQLE